MIYLTFVSLGLPDSLLGSAWPVMYPELGAPVAAQSALSMLISACTIVSSLATAKLVRRWGTGRLVAASVGLTAAAILGFSACREFWQLVLLTLPYGLGAGAIDSALNNYVAIHYGPRHMSWLHCCWGIGTSVGPVAMGWALAGPLSWHGGYLVIGAAQATITAALVASLPLWRRTGADRDGAAVADGAKMAESSDAAGAGAGNEGCVNDAAGASRANGDAADSGSGCADKTCGSSSNGDNPGTSHEGGEGQGGSAAKPLSYPELLRLPGAAAVIGSFGCYSALESSMGLWIASHLVLARGIGEAQAASMVALFYLGITFGRFVSGVVANRVAGRNMIRAGQVVIACGLVLLVTCKNDAAALSAAIALVGLGCAPIYPSIVALTPSRFGEAASQGMVSLQMACAYVGSTFFPPVCALVAGAGAAGALPWLYVAVLALMVALSELANRRTARVSSRG